MVRFRSSVKSIDTNLEVKKYFDTFTKSVRKIKLHDHYDSLFDYPKLKELFFIIPLRHQIPKFYIPPSVKKLNISIRVDNFDGDCDKKIKIDGLFSSCIETLELHFLSDGYTKKFPYDAEELELTNFMEKILKTCPKTLRKLIIYENSCHFLLTRGMFPKNITYLEMDHNTENSDCYDGEMNFIPDTLQECHFRKSVNTRVFIKYNNFINSKNIYLSHGHLPSLIKKEKPHDMSTKKFIKMVRKEETEYDGEAPEESASD